MGLKTIDRIATLTTSPTRLLEGSYITLAKFY